MHRQPVLLLLAVSLLPSACTGDDVPADGETSDAETTGETGAPIFEPPEAECGNGYLEPGEQCDDGNLIDGDGCDSLCQIPCGMLWEATLPSPAADVVPTVIDLAVGPKGEIVVLGLLDAPGPELDDDVWLGAWSSAGEPLWSGNHDLLDSREDAPAGVAVGPDGAVYVSATVQMMEGTDIWVGRFDETGTRVWEATFDSPIADSNDAASGIAITAAGNPLVAGKMRVGDGDTDLWLAELSAEDGGELWSTTWSGAVAANGFSLDVGGPVTVASDGTIWATAVEYVSFDTLDVHVLSFDPAGALLGDWAPQANVAVAHRHAPDGIAVAADGHVYFSISRLGSGSTFWLHRLDPSEDRTTGEIAWTRELPSFVDTGKDWALNGVATGPEGNVFVGGLLRRDDKDAAWYEAWLHRLDPAGEPLCSTRHAATGSTILTPTLLVTAIAASPTGELIAAGRLADVENANSFWLGAFRGP